MVIRADPRMINKLQHKYAEEQSPHRARARNKCQAKMLWPRYCECQANAFGNEPPTLCNCRLAGGDCGSSVARPSAASADSLGYRAAQASPALRPPWPFPRALRARRRQLGLGAQPGPATVRTRTTVGESTQGISAAMARASRGTPLNLAA